MDISGHFFKEEGVKLLGKELPSLKKLTHLSFENSGISSFDPIHELIKTAEGLHKKMKISWPSKDLQNIYKAKKVSSDELTDLKAELHSISTGLYDVLQSRRASVGLDEAFAKELAEKIKDSPPAKRGSFRIGSSRNKKTSSSEFIRAGSVRNIKRPLLDKSSTEQDPDSIFIKPFEAWLARVKGEFPEFYNEELEHEFPLTNIQLSEQEQREIEAKNMMKPHNHDDISEQSSSSSKKSSKENIITRDIKLEESDSDKLKNPKPRKLDNKEASSSSSSSVEKRKKIPKKDFGVTVDTINKPPPQDATDKIIPIGVKKEEEKKKSKPPVPLKVIQPMPPKRKIKAEAEQPEPPKKEEKKPKKVEPVKKVEKKETPKKVTPIKKIEPVKKVEKKESPKKDNAKPAPQLKPVDEVLKPLPEVTQIEKPPKEEKPEKKKPSPTKKTTLKKVEPVKKVEKKVTPIKKLEPVKKVEKKKEPKVQTREVEIVPDEPLAHLSSSSSSSSSDENIPKKEQPAEIKTRDVELSESSSSSDDEKKEAPKKEEKPVKKEEKPVKKETPKKVEPKKEEKKPVKKVEKKEITPKKPSQKRRPEPELGEEVSVLHNKIIVEEVSSLHVSSSSSSSSSSEDEAVIIPRAVSPKTGRTTAPDLDIENPHLVVDDLPEAVTFEAPSWTFPIPRTTRVSNKHLVKELEEKYSTHAVINALKSTK
ncbi:hypothetical protein TRFO_06109 [Tritrichomonas foetus]|uniref:Uncharacterized protein n=1 Tax=Tritrichomonas foetus TaxID=1144522 RepID=A0A1J4K0Z3_9EUKA|nr:hypothetical protein TRFO_06109 [Tritrichomonas foetus]|eukprot:OHT05097.1 hypothetical protein TRFO_06109 [Tritrichomonas foetus]